MLERGGHVGTRGMSNWLNTPVAQVLEGGGCTWFVEDVKHATSTVRSDFYMCNN